MMLQPTFENFFFREGRKSHNDCMKHIFMPRNVRPNQVNAKEARRPNLFVLTI